MLYKVTPMMPEEPKGRQKRDGQPRKRRGTAIYDSEGHEVLITLMCLKCRTVKPLAQFGLRKMADGAIRNQPWCRPCRSGAGTKVKKELESPVTAVASPAGMSAPAMVDEDVVEVTAAAVALAVETAEQLPDVPEDATGKTEEVVVPPEPVTETGVPTVPFIETPRVERVSVTVALSEAPANDVFAAPELSVPRAADEEGVFLMEATLPAVDEASATPPSDAEPQEPVSTEEQPYRLQ